MQLDAVEDRIYKLSRRYRNAAVRYDPGEAIALMQRLPGAASR
jgi:hypothetical protein